MKKSRRSRLLVDRLQYRLLFTHWIYFLLLLLVFAGTLFLPLVLRLRDPSTSLLERERVAEQFLSLHAYLWPAVLVLLLLLTFHSIFMSHRIAGPLVRFRHRFRQLGEGDLVSSIKLRQGDYLTDEANVMNEAVDSLSKRLEQVRRSSQEAEAAAAELRRRLSKSGAEPERREAELVVEKLGNLLEALAGLRLPERSESQFGGAGEPADDDPAEKVAALSGP